MESNLFWNKTTSSSSKTNILAFQIKTTASNSMSKALAFLKLTNMCCILLCAFISSTWRPKSTSPRKSHICLVWQTSSMSVISRLKTTIRVDLLPKPRKNLLKAKQTSCFRWAPKCTTCEFRVTTIANGMKSSSSTIKFRISWSLRYLFCLKYLSLTLNWSFKIAICWQQTDFTQWRGLT